MKKSELKEAIKSEITSVLSENLYGRGMTPEMADTVDALIQMLTPVDTIESLLDNLTDDLNELPDEIDTDFFINNIDAIEKEMYRQTRSIRFVKEGTGIFGTSLRDLDKYNPEDFEEAKFIKFKGDSDDNKMEVEAEREMNTPDGELKVYTVKTDDGVQSYTADQVELVKENVNPDLERKIVDFVRKRANEYGIPVYNAFLSIEAKMAEMKDFFGEGKYSLEENEDEDDKKAYKGAAKRDKKKSKRDKVIDAYNEIGGGKEVKEKAKKAKEGDKEALNWLKTNQPKIKAYNDLKK